MELSLSCLLIYTPVSPQISLQTTCVTWHSLVVSQKTVFFGGTIGSFTENYIHSLVCLLYTITRSLPSAIVDLTMTAHNPSFTLFVDPKEPFRPSPCDRAASSSVYRFQVIDVLFCVLSLLQKVNGFWNRPFVCVCGYRDMVAMTPSSSLFLSLFLVLCLNRVTCRPLGRMHL